MKTVNKLRHIRFAVLALFCAATLFSCSKWDEFKEYTKDGEITYAGKMDSVQVLSGKNRVQVKGKFNADPKIKMTKIYWNDFKDSVVFNIDKGSGPAYFDQTFAVDEGVKNFMVYNFDGSGNRSVKVDAIGKSFGSSYRRKLSNRFIASRSFANNNTTLTWDPMDLSTGAQYTEVEYVVNGETKTAITPANQPTTVLEGVKTTTTVKYRTIFKPDPTSIDTFAVPFKNYEVKFAPPLKNRMVPFVASATSGRWGNLADWISNDAVKNHGGFGGWDEWNGNIFNVESGWGSPAITNGKIYQTLELDPGTYTFEISDLRDTNLLETDNTYLVVALGNGLPDVAAVASSLGYVKIVNGKSLDQLRVKFTITQAATVSMGYLTTQAAGDPGKFCNIRAFDFYQN